MKGTTCDFCGERAVAKIAADGRDPETGYQDSVNVCRNFDEATGKCETDTCEGCDEAVPLARMNYRTEEKLCDECAKAADEQEPVAVPFCRICRRDESELAQRGHRAYEASSNFVCDECASEERPGIAQ